MKFSRKNIVVKIFETWFYTVAVCVAAMNQRGELNLYTVWLLLTVNLIGVLKARNNWYLLIVNVIFLYCNWSICYANVIGQIDSYFTSWADQQVVTKALLLLIVFFVMLNLFAPSKMSDRSEKHCLIVNNETNDLIVVGICVALVFVWVFGFTRPDIAGERGAPSTIYEYSIIFFILGFYYGGTKRFQMILTILLGAFALQNFVYGGRITGLQLLICWSLCVIIDKISIGKVAPVIVFLFFVLVSIGQQRASFVLSVNSLREAVEKVIATGGSLDTAYSAFFTSLTFLKTELILSETKRLEMFGLFILSIFFGGSVPDSNLAQFTHQYYLHYFGGVLPFFGHFYLGWSGVFAFSGIVIAWFRYIAKSNVFQSGLNRCLSIYIVSTAFRWYLYSPSQLLRGALLLMICYGVCFQVNHFMKSRI